MRDAGWPSGTIVKEIFKRIWPVPMGRRKLNASPGTCLNTSVTATPYDWVLGQQSHSVSQWLHIYYRLITPWIWSKVFVLSTVSGFNNRPCRVLNTVESVAISPHDLPLCTTPPRGRSSSPTPTADQTIINRILCPPLVLCVELHQFPFNPFVCLTGHIE